MDRRSIIIIFEDDYRAIYADGTDDEIKSKFIGNVIDNQKCVGVHFVEHCPSCRVNLTAGMIPKKSRHLFGEHFFFSRVFGITDQRRDRTTHCRCPDCNHIWERK